MLLLQKIRYLLNMGRKKIKLEEKKIRMSITIDPIIEKIVKERHINLSSLTNKLLFEYFKNENLH
jgi:hypothetical protein